MNHFLQVQQQIHPRPPICSVCVETSIDIFLEGREVDLVPLFCLAGARGVELYRAGGLIFKLLFFASTATYTS